MSCVIEITPDIRRRFSRAFKAARKSRYRVVWLEDDLVYVARRGKGHERYLVRFVLGANGRVSAYCRTTTNGECYGCKWKECCSHIAAVVLRWKPKKVKTAKAA